MLIKALTLTKDTFLLWLEVGKLIASIATPIVVAYVGHLFLKKIESVKSTISKQSNFDQKWADQYFECCQGFLRALERELALLKNITLLENKNSKCGLSMQKEINDIHITLIELELRLRRLLVFAPIYGPDTVKKAKLCLEVTANLVNARHGDTSEIISKISEFNIASRLANAEMLGLSN